jgi:hypothetical protein
MAEIRQMLEVAGALREGEVYEQLESAAAEGNLETRFLNKDGKLAGAFHALIPGAAIVVLVPKDDTSIAVMTNAKGWNGYLYLVLRTKKYP